MESTDSVEIFATQFSLSARRRKQLFNEIRKDPSITTDALPFWPPLFSLHELSRIATELTNDGEDKARD
eukprot:775582-Rhodomonas_salina.1